MESSNTIQITVPKEMSHTSRELLKATMEAMVSLRCDSSKDWDQVLRELERDGWHCAWQLNWAAEAKRGSEFEQASGKTLDATFEQLRQLTHLHLVENCP